MNLEKVIFGFFILLAATLNFGFVYGDISNPEHHHVSELFAAIVVNLVATVLKLGARTQLRDRLRTSATDLAQQKIEQLRLKSWSDTDTSPSRAASATVAWRSSSHATTTSPTQYSNRVVLSPAR